MRYTDETQYDIDLAIDTILNRYGAKPSALIMMLQDVQKHYHYLPIDALKIVAKKMNLPLAQIYAVATFFKAFTLAPGGKHHVCVCSGTACHVRQAKVIEDSLSQSLGVNPGETTSDGEISYDTVNCMGACALGPLVTVDGKYFGNMNVAKLRKVLNESLGMEVTGRTQEESK